MCRGVFKKKLISLYDKRIDRSSQKSKTPIYSTSVSQLFQWVERYFLKMLISLYDREQTEVDKNLKNLKCKNLIIIVLSMPTDVFL